MTVVVDTRVEVLSTAHSKYHLSSLHVSSTGEGGGEGRGSDGPGLDGLREQEVDVLAEDADKDKDFDVTDLDQCKVTM